VKVVFLSAPEKTALEMATPPEDPMCEHFRTHFRTRNLHIHETVIQKINQLDKVLHRSRGIALTGTSLTGKSTILDIYIETLKTNIDMDVKRVEIFPNSISGATLFGYREANEDWKEGILISNIKKQLEYLSQKAAELSKSQILGRNKMTRSNLADSDANPPTAQLEDGDIGARVFYVFDGEIELAWMDNLTTGLDMERNSLTTGNSEKILLSKYLNFIFLCPSLSKCTPAITSRLGILHLENKESKNFIWKHMIAKKITDWFLKHDRYPNTPSVSTKIKELFTNTLENILTDKKKNYKTYIPMALKDIANNCWCIMEMYLGKLYADDKVASNISLQNFTACGNIVAFGL
jgi:hypothetical protein